MKKKLMAIIAAGVLAVQVIAVPMLANAEETVKYVENSDYTDCAIGGNTGQGYHGLGIILDGSPWLSKGSASVHYQTYLYDDVRKVNYCNFYSNSDKTGSGDGAGSMYVYNRNQSTVNQMGPYGLVEFDLRVHSDSQKFNFRMGWFDDPTSGSFDASKTVALTVEFSPDTIIATNGPRTENVASITPEKWYKVRVTVNNKFEEYSISITDVETGKVVGQLEEASYSVSQPADCAGIKISCWGYMRGNTYNYDMTNVTIARSDTKYSIN